MRAHAVFGSILVVMSALLAGCGEEQESPKTGDIIGARVDDQFKDGAEATVMLPTGRLLVHAGEPVDSAKDDETRTRQSVDAPAGAVLVPISWQYDPWQTGRLDGILAATDDPVIDLVSDGERYRLPPPQLDDERGESFYVVVGGDAEDRSLQIEFDGVMQSVDLATGRADKGDAATLYDVDDAALKKEPCDEERWFDSALVVAEFSCELAGPVLTPYAGGEWAPEGRLWLALTIATELRSYDEADGLGGGARYTATDVKVKAAIDGAAPEFVLSAEDDANVCPVPASTACGWSKHLVFDVPADDAEQGPLDLTVSYRLRLAVEWGDWDPPERTPVEATEELKLWEDEADDRD